MTLHRMNGEEVSPVLKVGTPYLAFHFYDHPKWFTFDGDFQSVKLKIFTNRGIRVCKKKKSAKAQYLVLVIESKSNQNLS